MATIAIEIKDMKSWDEAEYWLTTHGWGPELIVQQKEAWDAAATPAPAPKPAPKVVASSEWSEKGFKSAEAYEKYKSKFN